MALLAAWINLEVATRANDEYRRILKRHGIGHTYNYWSAMPTLAGQAKVIPPEELPFVVIRLLLRPGTWYEDQRERFKPFNRVVEPDEGMRADVVTVTKRLLARKRRWRIRKTVRGTAARPRLAVRFTAKHIYAQAINDDNGTTMSVWKGGLYWVEEVGYSSRPDGTSPAIGYVDDGSAAFPPEPSSSMWRGASMWSTRT